MQSDQERLLNQFVQFSMGSRFVFAPDEWRKGGATREPADIVWACNDCVILMYMSHAEPSDNLERNIKKRNKAITHNLKQAKGWLREWRKGRSLTGMNEYASFSISYGEYRHLVILSVIAGADPVSRYHHIEAIKLNVSMCATLPQKLVEELARLGGTAIDFITFIAGLCSTGREISQVESLEHLTRDYKNILRNVDPGSRWLLVSPEGYINKYVRMVFRRLKQPSGKNGDFSDMAEILNDMLMQDTLSLIIALLEWREQIEPDWNKVAIQKLSLIYYDFVIAVCDIRNFSLATDQLQKFILDNQDRERLAFSFFWLRHLPGAESPIIAIMENKRPSFTRFYLDNFVQGVRL